MSEAVVGLTFGSEVSPALRLLLDLKNMREKQMGQRCKIAFLSHLFLVFVSRFCMSCFLKIINHESYCSLIKSRLQAVAWIYLFT